MATAISSDDYENLKCPVCLEIYEKPMTTPCKHSFCKSCLNHSKPPLVCPLCRVAYRHGSVIPAQDIQDEINSRQGECSGCHETMPLNQMRRHNTKCSRVLSLSGELKFKPVAETSQPIPSNLPNRATFACPYCSKPNLDCQGLLKHCNHRHKGETSEVVCPVCASMPWGDPDLRSSNFIGHLNNRHKFEYDTYVDFEQDEDDMLKAALAASLQNE